MFIAAVVVSVLASSSPASSSSPSPAPARIGLILDKTVQPITQPSFDRWAHDAADRFAQAFSVSIVPLPPDNGGSVADSGTCDAAHLAGFVYPRRYWHLSESAVTVTANLDVYDCDGDRFFAAQSTQTDKRIAAMIPQQQLESAASRATADLLQQFATFERGHAVLWSRLLTTGTIQ